MKSFARVCLWLALAGIPVAAIADTPTAQDPDSQLVEHGHYINKDGNVVHSPAHSKTGEVPAGATARCRDGTFSFSQHRRGTCSRHGGVSDWLG